MQLSLSGTKIVSLCIISERGWNTLKGVAMDIVTTVDFS
jgi:hypothetical protein